MIYCQNRLMPVIEYQEFPSWWAATSIKVTHQHQLRFLVKSQDLSEFLLCLWQLFCRLLPDSPQGGQLLPDVRLIALPVFKAFEKVFSSSFDGGQFAGFFILRWPRPLPAGLTLGAGILIFTVSQWSPAASSYAYTTSSLSTRTGSSTSTSLGTRRPGSC